MNIVILILQLIPSIIAAMKAIEEAVPGAGLGQLKLSAIREILEVTDAKVTEHWPQIEKVIGVLVKLFNATGTFFKK